MKKTMKSLFLMLFATSLLAGCGGKKKVEPKPTPSGEPTQQSSSPVAPTSEPSGEPSVEPSETTPIVSPTVEPTTSGEPYNPSPVVTPTEEPSEPAETTPVVTPTVSPTETEEPPSPPTPTEVTPTVSPVVPTSEPAEEEHTVTITARELGDGYGWQNATAYLEFNLDTVVSVSATKGTNNGKYYEPSDTYPNGTYRLYAADNGAITISVGEGHLIKSVKLTYNIKDNGALDGMKSGVAKEVNAQSVTYNAISTSGEKGKVFISEFEVTYTGEAGKDPFERDGWTEDELKVLEDYFYGVEVPYIYFKGNGLLSYDDYSESAEMTGAVITKDQFDEYAALFMEDWDCLDSEDYYQFEQCVVTDDGNRYVNAIIALVDEDGYLVDEDAEEGIFYLALSDPYYYEWPLEVINYYVAMLGSESSIPAVNELDRIYINAAEIETESYFIIGVQTELSAEGYAALLEGWDVDEDKGYYFAISPTSDLAIEFFFYEGTLVISVEKYLAHLDAFPMAAVLEYNGGFEVVEVKGAEYYTGEVLKEVLDFFGEILEFELGYNVIAYGLSSSDYATYLNELEEAGWKVVESVDEEEGVSYLATKINEEGVVYSYTFTYEDEELNMLFAEPSNIFASEQFPTDALNAFLEVREVEDVEVPVLAIEEGELYYYSTTLDSDEYYDNFSIEVNGNYEIAWTTTLSNNGYDVPDEPDEEYGYECFDETGTIEIDILYNEESDVTYATVYIYMDFFD